MTINDAVQWLMHYGVAVLFVIVLLEQAGLPAPGAPVLIASGSLARDGRISLFASIGAAIVACLIADYFWFHVGRRDRFTSAHKGSHRPPGMMGHIRDTAGALTRRGAIILTIAKVVPGPNLASPLAGISGMAPLRFVLSDCAAAAVWAGGCAVTGYLLNRPLHHATLFGAHFGLALLVVVSCLFVIIAVLRARRNRFQRRRLAAILASGLLLSLAFTAAAQSGSTVAGSVPSGTATGEELHLTLRDSISMALKYNLGAIESGENSRSARGQRLLALSSLLPQVSASASETVNQTSLATLGLKPPVYPSIIGPYSYTTLNVSASQTLFSIEAIQRLRGARTAEQAAQLNYKDTLDVVTLAVGNAYLQVLRSSSNIDVHEAQVRNAQALYNQAASGYEAGTRPRIDTTRTEVQLRSEQYQLIVARNDLAIAKLTLARAIGLPLGQSFTTADALPYAAMNPPTLDDALKVAYTARSDYAAALSTQKAAERTLAAAKAERYPVLSTTGNYADVGTTLGHSHGTFGFQAGVSIPVFTGRRIEGEIAQADAHVRQRKAEAENVRGQIDYDVRAAYLNLEAAKQQVEVAAHNADLANESLSRSRERFASGVAGSVEVVQAQQSLASANDQSITSTYNHNLAKLELARALGVARTSYDQYLGGK